MIIQRYFVFALTAWLLAGCVAPRDAWRRLDAHVEPYIGCSPTEIIIVEGRYFRVRDLRGNLQTRADQPEPLSGAHIRIRTLGGGAVIGETLTGTDGSFQLLRPPDGWYQLESCLDGFESVVVPVLVEKNAAESQITLRVGLGL